VTEGVGGGGSAMLADTLTVGLDDVVGVGAGATFVAEVGGGGAVAEAPIVVAAVGAPVVVVAVVVVAIVVVAIVGCAAVTPSVVGTVGGTFAVVDGEVDASLRDIPTATPATASPATAAAPIHNPVRGLRACVTFIDAGVVPSVVACAVEPPMPRP